METKTETRNIAGRQFRVVEQGLDEGEVSEFIRELLKKLRAAEGAAKAMDGTAIAESDRLIRMVSEEAQQVRANAKAEASRIIAEAESVSTEQAESAQKITKATAEEARKVLERAREQADLHDRVARRKAEQMVESVRRRIVARVPHFLRDAQQTVLDDFERLRSEVESLGSELGGS